MYNIYLFKSMLEILIRLLSTLLSKNSYENVVCQTLHCLLNMYYVGFLILQMSKLIFRELRKAINQQIVEPEIEPSAAK